MRCPKHQLALYAVTDHRTPVEQLVDNVRAMVSGGVTIVQLRNPDITALALYQLGLALKDALDGTGVPLIVNDRVDVAAALGVGVHVGQNDLPVSLARRIVGPDVIVGLSITDSLEINSLDEQDVDYLGVGPIYPTSTKPDAAPALGLDGLARCRALSDLPIVAIGGIDLTNAAEVMRHGADGLAVVSALSQTASPAETARQFRKIINGLQA